MHTDTLHSALVTEPRPLPRLDVSPLQTRGFVVIPGFLSADDVTAFTDDFRGQPLVDNKNYGVSAASAEANARLRPRITDVLTQVHAQTDLRPDSPSGAAYFATGRGISFAWHQDHESFYAYQNHYDYLNFYIPIVKPRRDKSNLSVLPFDTLLQNSPRTYARVVRSGATRIVRLGPASVVFKDDTGGAFIVRRNLDRLAFTPHLAAGDLLLMRGDVIHRTQDTDTDRVAMSFRVCSSDAVINRVRLADGGLHKARMMARNPAGYERTFEAFAKLNRDDVPIRELNGVARTIAAGPPRHGRTFVWYLLRQKYKAGVLGRFLPKVAVNACLSTVIDVHDRIRGAA